jgi:hypothetical protein
MSMSRKTVEHIKFLIRVITLEELLEIKEHLEKSIVIKEESNGK